ncbi:MAG: GNAT family N-acetyltransferase [Cyclobacteriaceae bacterium]
MKLVKCTISDAQEIINIGKETFQTAFGHQNNPVDVAEYLGRSFDPEKISNELASEDISYYLAKIGNEAIGYIKLKKGFAQNEFQNEGGIELERLYVHAKTQGKGFGSILLNRAIAISKEAGFPFIWLGVWEKNIDAIRFYKRHGFERIGEHQFLLGKDLQTDWLMKLHL